MGNIVLLPILFKLRVFADGADLDMMMTHKDSILWICTVGCPVLDLFILFFFFFSCPRVSMEIISETCPDHN